MTRIFLLALTLLCTISINAQDLTQTIRGKIIDSQSESPLIGATIIVVGTDPLQGAVTDVNGEFLIPKVQVGRHNLAVTYIGYEDAYLSDILVGSGKQVELNISLTESLSKLEEVVIVANDNRGEPINELSSVSALSFSVEQTSRYAATFDDPARAALSFAGVTTGGDDILNEIVIRGNSPNGLLWRIEGVEVPNPNHFAEVGSAAGGISMLSNNMLSNSDFFTGAFPAEYGNAFSGVFDISLRNGNNQKREYAFQAGFLGVAAALEGPFSANKRGSYLINYRYSTLALFDHIGIKILDENEDITFSDLSFKLNFPTEKLGTFSVWGLGGTSVDKEIADPEIDEYYNWRAGNLLGVGGLSHIFYLNKNTYLESKLSAHQRTIKYDEDSVAVKETYAEDFIDNTIRFSTLINSKLNARNTLRSGVIYSHTGYNLKSREFDYELDRLITDVDSKGNTGTFQAYSQWQYRLNERLTFNTGLHYLQLMLNNNYSIEPRFGMRYKLDNKQTLSFGTGIHSKQETISTYLSTIEDGSGNLIRPNEDLELMKAYHNVIGYERSIGQNWRLKTEVYYQHLYDVPIRPNTRPDEPGSGMASILNMSGGFVTDTLVNEGKGRNYGLELTAERFFNKGFYLVFTGSIFESKYTAADDIERNTRFNSNYIFNVISGKEFKVGKSKNNLISINTKLITSGNNRFIPIDLNQSRDEGYTILNFENAYAERLDPYWRIDFGIKYIRNKPKTTQVIALNVQNLTGRLNEAGRYYNPFSVQIGSDEQLGMFPNLSYRLEF